MVRLQKGLNFFFKGRDGAGMAGYRHVHLPDLEVLILGELDDSIGIVAHFRIVRILVHFLVEGLDIAGAGSGEIFGR